LKKYHVYALCDPRKQGPFVYGVYQFIYEPFYIGISSTKRRQNQHLIIAYSFLDKKEKGHNSLKCNKIRKIKSETGLHPFVVILKNELNKEEAIAEEILLIKIIGRKNTGDGFLTNITAGGETTGLYGKLNPNYGKRWSVEQKEHLSMVRKGSYIKEKNPNYGHYWAES